MLNAQLWETVNGALAVLGVFIVGMVIVYLVRNIHRTYHEPVRFITLAFAAVILGHTIKDSAAYLARCCAIGAPDTLIITALVLVAIGKLGCIRIWSEPRWGHWPWVMALAALGVFLVADWVS